MKPAPWKWKDFHSCFLTWTCSCSKAFGSERYRLSWVYSPAAIASCSCFSSESCTLQTYTSLLYTLLPSSIYGSRLNNKKIQKTTREVEHRRSPPSILPDIVQMVTIVVVFLLTVHPLTAISEHEAFLLIALMRSTISSPKVWRGNRSHSWLWTVRALDLQIAPFLRHQRPLRSGISLLSLPAAFCYVRSSQKSQDSSAGGPNSVSVTCAAAAELSTDQSEDWILQQRCTCFDIDCLII